MSSATDSPAHSGSDDDFAAMLDAELEACSSGSPPDEEDHGEQEADADNGNDNDNEVDCDVDNEDDKEEDGGNDGLNDHRKKARKTQKLDDLEEPQGSTSQGLIEENLELSLKKDKCTTHPGSFEQVCILCGQILDEEAGVTLDYIYKGLRLGDEEIDRLHSMDMKNVLCHKKLYLVLDLDHTLLNSTQLDHLTSEEVYLMAQCDSLQDVSKGSLFMLDSMNMMTKLRPFVRTFLKEASEMFEMYIYTMGDRPYALEMSKLLDPQKVYFDGRVISRDNGTQNHQKSLDVILGQDSAVSILDDTENAWIHKDNVILIDRYHFFASSCHQFGYNCKSFSQLKRDESEADGILASVLKVLREIHRIFFNELDSDLASRDVRQVLKTVRKKVLKDCKIVFASDCFPMDSQPENHPLWKKAEQLGATCSTEIDSSTSHVVSTSAGSEKSLRAVKENKSLVHPRWIDAAKFLWRKQPEENFPVSQTKNQ